MTWQITPVIWIYILAIVTCWLTAVVAWRHRETRGAKLIAVTMIATSIWALGYTLGAFNSDLTWKLNTIRLEYIGISSVPILFFFFTLAYTPYERWLTRRNVIILSIIPAVCLVLALTHEYHHLIYKSFSLTTFNGWVVSKKVYGPAFWTLSIYSYIVVFIGSILLIRDVLRHPRMYQWQSAIIVIAALIPFAINITTITGLNKAFRPYDASSLAFSISGLLILIDITRFKLLNLAPVAHDLVFRYVSSGVIVINAEGLILELNPAAEEIVGRKQEEIVGKRIPDVFPEHKDLIEKFSGVVETRTQITLSTNQRTYDLQIAPLYHRSKARGVSGRIFLLNDITEHEQLIADLNAYAHTVAHDLKNPISTMQGYAQLLNSRYRQALPTDAQHITERINNSSIKMTSIINSLLLLAAIRRSEEVRLAIVDMRPVVADALSRLEQTIKETNAEIIQPTEWPENTRVRSYAPWLEEVWVNYIGNAIKYGGTPAHVEIGATVLPDQKVRFWVKDNGKGITEEEKAKLFTEFSRLDQHANIEGHGLGLSIVQRIATRLGGIVGIESNPGEGSTFYFILPALVLPTLTLPQPPEAKQLTA